MKQIGRTAMKPSPAEAPLLAGQLKDNMTSRQHAHSQVREATALEGAAKLRALGDTARFSVLVALLRAGPQSVSQLQAMLDMEQSLLSHHLSALRALGLVTATRQGRCVIYTPADSISCSKESNTIHLGCCSVMIPKSSLW
jgi:ArsR family transcriptional regulator